MANRYSAMDTAMNGEKGDKSSSSEQHKSFIRLTSKSGSEHVHYSVVYEGFPHEFQAMADKELNETPEARKKGLHRLREYVKMQGKPPFKDDLPLLAALRSCKYDVEKAESKLKKLLNMRQEVSAQLRNLGMETIERIVDDISICMYPYRDKFGRVIFNTRPNVISPEHHYSIPELGLMGRAGLLFQLSFPITTVSGFAYIADFAAPYHMYYTILKECRTLVDLALSTPFRIACIQAIHTNSVVRSFYNIFKTLISKKFLKKITLHGNNLEQIHEIYGVDLLPEEYGGNAGPISNKSYRQKFLDFIKDLMNEEF